MCATRFSNFRSFPGYFRVNFRVPIGSASLSSGYSGLSLYIKGKVIYGMGPSPVPRQFPESHPENPEKPEEWLCYRILTRNFSSVRAN